MDSSTGKQRQSPLSSWIGKQLLGQKIPKRYLDKEGNLQMMQGFDGSAVKHILEKAVEIAEEVKATSEWHRRMTRARGP